MGADINLAWPTAQIVMGASGAVGSSTAKAEAGRRRRQGRRGGQKEYEAEYEETLVNPYMAAERTSSTRSSRRQTATDHGGLRLLDRKVVNVPAKKHGNIPL